MRRATGAAGDMRGLATEEWNRVERSLRTLFENDGYEAGASVELAYIAVQAMQNAEGLFKCLPRLRDDSQSWTQEEVEELMLSVHMMCQDHKILEKGANLLMRHR